MRCGSAEASARRRAAAGRARGGAERPVRLAGGAGERHGSASRRHLLLLLLLGGGVLRPGGARAETALPRPGSLAAEARAAIARGEPLVLLVSLAGCPFCEQVRSAYLAPLQRDGASVWQINIGSAAAVVDFDGARRSHDAVISARGARFAPTVLFLGTRGEEVGERLVGASIPDFYGALLDERLQAARKRIAGR